SQAFQFHLLSYADRCESANYILIYHPKIRRASYSYYLYPARKSFVQRSLFFNITSLLYHNVSIFIDVNLFKGFYVNCWGEIKISLQFITLFGFHSGGNFSLSAGG